MTLEQRELWIRERRTGIGSSDAAAICGKSAWKTAYEVWLDKLGQIPDVPPSEQMRWGLLLESALAEAYSERTGIALEKPPLLRHETHSWMLASLDRRWAGGKKPVELKCANQFAGGQWGKEGTDDIPEAYLIQVHHQMAVVGAEECDVAALIGGHDFRIYTVGYNPAVGQHLMSIEYDFWQKVRDKIPPEPDWLHPRTLELVKLVNPATGPEIEITDEATLELINQFEGWKEQAKEAEGHKERCQAQLIHLMGHASSAVFPDGTVISRTKRSRKAHQVKACEYFDFRVKRNKVPASQT